MAATRSGAIRPGTGPGVQVDSSAPASRSDSPNQVRVAYPQRVPVVMSKKKCCKDRPRCKKCPLVLKRLSDVGLAERLGNRSDGREFRLVKNVPKKVLKDARSR